MNFLQKAETALAKWWQGLEGELEGDLASAGKVEANAVASTLTSVVPTLVEGEVQALASGNAAQAGPVAAKVLAAAGQQLANSTVQVSTQTLLTGMGQLVNSMETPAKAGS